MSDNNQPQHQERGAGVYARLGWVLTIVGAGSFFAWASLAPLDEGIPVQGTVVVSGKRKAVQSLGAGVVSQILYVKGNRSVRVSRCFVWIKPRSKRMCNRCARSTAWRGPVWPAGTVSAITCNT